MPKTNHNRNFSDERDYSCPPGDWCRGKHGAAKNKRGAKKFKRSRQRFHQNAQLARLNEESGMEPTQFDRGRTEQYSKLRVTSGSGPLICTACGWKAKVLTVQNKTEVCGRCVNHKSVT